MLQTQWQATRKRRRLKGKTIEISGAPVGYRIGTTCVQSQMGTCLPLSLPSPSLILTHPRSAMYTLPQHSEYNKFYRIYAP